MEAEVSSVEEKGSLVVDALAQNEGNSWAGSGANPWHLDSNTESILFLTDMSDKPAPIGFSITANGVHYYLIDLTLQPHETRMIDLRKVRDAQIPDFKGNKIPAGVTDGSIDWIRLANVPVSGRLMVINRQAGMTSSYDCTNCCCPGQFSSMSAQPDIFDAVLMSEFSEFGIASFADCDNNITYYNETNGSTWASSDPSVCSIAGPGTIDAVGPGSCTISASFESPGWTWDGGECFHGFPIQKIGYSNDTVQKPFFVKVVKASTSSTCSGASCLMQLWYQVLDTNQVPIRTAGLKIVETTSMTSASTCTGNFDDAGKWQTDTTGTMTTPDNWWWCCLEGANCYFYFKQTFTVNGYPVLIINGAYNGSYNLATIQCSNGKSPCPTVVPQP